MKMKRYVLLLCLVSLSLSALPALYITQPVRHIDARNLAMGDVQGSNAEGLYALFMNPAGIVRKNEAIVHAGGLGVSAALEPELVTAAQDYAQHFQGVGSIPEMNELLSHADFRNGVGASESHVLGASFYGLAAGINYNTDFLVRQFSLEEPVSMDYQFGLTMAGGGSVRLKLGKNDLYVGASVRKEYQAFSQAQIVTDSAADLVANWEFQDDIPAVLASGIAFDAGVMYSADPFMLSLTVRDIGGTTLTCQESTFSEAVNLFTDSREALAKIYSPSEFFDPSGIKPTFEGEYIEDLVIPMSIIVGGGVDLNLFDALRLQLLGEYRVSTEYITSLQIPDNTSPDTFWQDLHLGAELDLLDMFQIRAGINQGYLTGGVGLSFIRFFSLIDLSMNLTYYSWEAGSYAGQSQTEALKFDVILSL
ncbi:MAG: hypothetical protein JXK93_11575 [Sphaerochaetaceae bacterium]|nr:hypothetical protein [Sphaerochaetaceae bacterium]